VLRSGESLEEAVAAIKKVPDFERALDACLFNCTSPEVMVEAMPRLKAMTPPGIGVGGYANGFVTAASGEGSYRDLGTSEYYTDFVSKWVSSGADVVGGCCGIFPRHIAAVRAGLDSTAAL